MLLKKKNIQIPINNCNFIRIHFKIASNELVFDLQIYCVKKQDSMIDCYFLNPLFENTKHTLLPHPYTHTNRGEHKI